MFCKKKPAAVKEYDREQFKPVMKCSICNGEKVAGFQNIRTGKFEEIMLIRSEADLQDFMRTYGIESVTKEY